jgi:hypothetical protein
VLVVCWQVGVKKFVHGFRQANDSPTKLHFLKLGLVFGVARFDGFAFVSRAGDSDQRND